MEHAAAYRSCGCICYAARSRFNLVASFEASSASNRGPDFKASGTTTSQSFPVSSWASIKERPAGGKPTQEISGFGSHRVQAHRPFR
jgi:hypothetical protein